jgi:hypothetical protein
MQMTIRSAQTSSAKFIREEGNPMVIDVKIMLATL